MIGGLVIAVMGGGLFAYQNFTREPLNPETGCPESGADSLTVVMVDGSDPLTARQRAFVVNQLEDVKEETPVGGALKVYRLGTDMEDLLEPLAFVCNPGRAEDVNELVASPKRVERRWNEVFQSRLDEVFKKLLKPGQEDWSPIFESVQSVGITNFSDNDWEGKPKKLVIISDLLQYTPRYSHYEDPGDFEEFKNIDYYKEIRTNLKGVEVTLYYVPRDTQRDIQGQEHLEFWKDYFINQGAKPGDPAFFVHVQG
ncbi:hypothetical protein ACFOW6_12115 [Fodinicurvata halophila]|uniref:Uncharacterized protein n=1 Tax=Fodinicurvata halophila TaxID=1419723 RepID=A0ABV8UNY9_9PROT